MSNWTDLVVSIVVALIPVIAGYATKKLVANKQALGLVSTLEPLAKAAVVAVEQLGTQYDLDGSTKKAKATKSVLNSLSQLGFTQADADMVGSAIEKAFADSKAELHATYKEGEAIETKK